MVDVVIDMQSVDTRYATLNGHIQGEDFLDTAKYPTATFKSTKVTNFINIPHPMLKADAIGADASVVIKRSEFNADKFAPHVGDDVTITISLEAVKS